MDQVEVFLLEEDVERWGSPKEYNWPLPLQASKVRNILDPEAVVCD